MAFLSAIPIVGKIVDGLFSWVDQAVEDKDEANRLKANLQQNWVSQNMGIIQRELDAQARTVTAEINGKSWLQRNWRPLLMLSFTYIIVHNYVLVPIFGLPAAAIPPDMWQLLKIGVGGYVVGRSAEKIAPQIFKQREAK